MRVGCDGVVSHKQKRDEEAETHGTPSTPVVEGDDVLLGADARCSSEESGESGDADREHYRVDEMRWGRNRWLRCVRLAMLLLELKKCTFIPARLR